MTGSKIDEMIPLLQMNPVFRWHPCISMTVEHRQAPVSTPSALVSSKCKAEASLKREREQDRLFDSTTTTKSCFWMATLRLAAYGRN